MEKRTFFTGTEYQGDVIQRARDAVAGEQQIAVEFHALLFPKTGVQFTDRMLSHGRQYLDALISMVEKRICDIANRQYAIISEVLLAIASTPESRCLALFEKAGLLEGSEIIDHIFIQVQRAELETRLLQKITQTQLEAALTRNLDHGNSNIASAAMALLVAQGRANSVGEHISVNIDNIPSELLYEIAWPITAILAKLAGINGTELNQATEFMLRQHDEGEGIGRRAQRLAKLIESDVQKGANPHPITDGLTLFIARLAERSGVSAEQIVRFTAQPNMTPLIVLLRALNFPSQDALSIVASLANGENSLTFAAYHEIDREKALAAAADWMAPPGYQRAKHLIARAYSGLSDQ